MLHLLMSELVGDGVGDLQPRVLIHVAGALRLTHTRDLRDSQRGTPVCHAAADVVPEGGDDEGKRSTGGERQVGSVGRHRWR